MSVLLTGVAWLSWAAMGAAQEPAMVPQPAAVVPPSDRPGLWHWGPFWVTPRFRLGTVGLDTNVFYTATDRRTDFSASGGPGLSVVVPMHAARLLIDGDLNYVYFVKTASQRRPAGGGRARLEVGQRRVRAGIEETFDRTFARPNFEVDRRVVGDQWTSRGDLKVDLPGHLGIRADLSVQRINLNQGQDYYGTDLSTTLNRDVRLGILGLVYRITPKTSLIAEGDYQQDRFKIETERDADSNRVYGGFEVVSLTRFSGRVVAGVRLFRPKDQVYSDKRAPYYDAIVRYTFGLSTLFSLAARRDLEFSAFRTTGSTPTIQRETFEARLEKRFYGRVSLWIFGGHDQFLTDGEVSVVDGLGRTTTAVRNDGTWRGGADLGYYFRSRLRIGVAATYTERTSRFTDFGLQGLLVGATVTYRPN
jgi:hypothetical protein